MQGNCHNIAHYICLYLRSKNIVTSKGWVFAPSAYNGNDSTCMIVEDINKLSLTGLISWGYHVMPVIWIQEENALTEYVFDPCLYPDGPVKYQTWADSLYMHGQVKIIIDYEWYLYNRFCSPKLIRLDKADTKSKNKNYLTGRRVNYFYKYIGECKENYWLEKGLAVNETAIVFYSKELNEIDQDLLNDYKNIVGNIHNFEFVLKKKKTEIFNKDFYLKHKKIVNDYRNVLKWKRKKWKILVKNCMKYL